MTTSQPGRCLSFALTLVATCAPARADDRPGRAPEFEPGSDLAAKVTEYMQARARVSGFSGAVLVAHSGRPIVRQGYGLANQEFDTSNTPETKFRLGSAGKQFTAAAILLLEQRGKLKLTDPV